MPTHRDEPWEHDRRARRSGGRWSGPRWPATRHVSNAMRLGMGVLALGTTAGVIHLSSQRGATASPPATVMRETGPWKSRWVKVVNPATGGPRYVRERYREIHYVSATP